MPVKIFMASTLRHTYMLALFGWQGVDSDHYVD